MNTNLGLIGKKLGCTQIFDRDGQVTRVTVVEAGPCVVLAKRTKEKHGYSALQIGYGEKREKLVTKPVKGYFAKLEQAPTRVVRELRLPEEVVAKYEVGHTIKVSDIFHEGMFVDVSGNTRGRGFTGVMRRHNFKGSKNATHGTHEYQRHAGSIGCRKTPGRTFPGMRMAGHYGDERVTTQNLKVAKVLEDKNIVLVAGAVPGARNGFVTVRTAVKKKVKSATAA